MAIGDEQELKDLRARFVAKVASDFLYTEPVFECARTDEAMLGLIQRYVEGGDPWLLLRMGKRWAELEKEKK